MGARNIKSSPVRYRKNGIAGGTLVVLASITYLLYGQFRDRLSDSVPEIALTVLVLGVAFLIIYVAGLLFAKLATRETITWHQHEAAYRFVQLTTFGVVIFIIAIPIWEFAIGNVLLGAGLASVVLAVAARKTIGAVLSGVIIMSTDIFRVGDWVKIDNQFGRIDHISLFNTRVLSPHGEIHILPNDQLTARDITNLSNNRYRNDVLIGVDYDTDLSSAIDVCNAVLQELSEAERTNVDGFNPTSIKSFDESQITLAVKVWIREPTPWAINQAQTTVLSELHTRFQHEGIQIPFPQRMVSERTPGVSEPFSGVRELISETSDQVSGDTE